MIDVDELDKKTLREKWEVITDEVTCPYPLKPFAGSRLLSNTSPKDDSRSTALLVELKPGLTFNAVAHLTDSLASFLDMPRDGIWIEGNAAKARRVEITIIEEEK